MDVLCLGNLNSLARQTLPRREAYLQRMRTSAELLGLLAQLVNTKLQANLLEKARGLPAMVVN